MKGPTPEVLIEYRKNNPAPPLTENEWKCIYRIFYDAMVRFYEANPEEHKKVLRHNAYIKSKEKKKTSKR